MIALTNTRQQTGTKVACFCVRKKSDYDPLGIVEQTKIEALISQAVYKLGLWGHVNTLSQNQALKQKYFFLKEIERAADILPVLYKVN